MHSEFMNRYVWAESLNICMAIFISPVNQHNRCAINNKIINTEQHRTTLHFWHTFIKRKKEEKSCRVAPHFPPRSHLLCRWIYRSVSVVARENKMCCKDLCMWIKVKVDKFLRIYFLFDIFADVALRRVWLCKYASWIMANFISSFLLLYFKPLQAFRRHKRITRKMKCKNMKIGPL